MRDLWPRTLLGRNILLLLCIVIIGQATTLSLVNLVVGFRVSDAAALSAVQISALRDVLAMVPNEQRTDYIRRLDQASALRIEPAPMTVSSNRDEWPDGPQLRQFLGDIQSRLPQDMTVVWRSGTATHIWIHAHIGNDAYWIGLPAGRPLRETIWTFMVVIVAAIGVLVLIGSLLIQRRINRPLARLGEGVRQIGAGGHPDTLPADGPVELSRLVEQFNAMAGTLRRNEEDRAIMLAGISHDIRTPLTKLRLRLAMQHPRDPAFEAATDGYIGQINAIIQQFVDFGRAGGGESLVPGDLNTLVAQLAAEFEERDQIFELALAPLPPCAFRPIAMLRAITNLMENAVKYGGSGLLVQTCAQEGRIGVVVMDRGPGIEPADRTRMLQPFVRADAARGTSGTGLGLSIVARIAAMHGGSLELLSRHGGGLRAELWIAVSA